jgi:hypothetical protein
MSERQPYLFTASVERAEGKIPSWGYVIYGGRTGGSVRESGSIFPTSEDAVSAANKAVVDVRRENDERLRRGEDSL